MTRPALVIAGPTAAGKTGLALQIAERWPVALVSADAMAVYRGMDIGTAKPSAADLARFPHACLDVRDPDEEFSVADFVAEVRRVHAENERVLVVGGTPFYLSALVRPLTELPPADPDVRARFETLEDPHAALAEVDPVTARRLHPNDRVRIVRALEVHALTGRPLSRVLAEGARHPAVPCEVCWLDRDDLRERIEARVHQMIGDGYIDEVRRLLDAGWSRDLKPMRSLGYKHMVAHLLDGVPLDEAIRLTIRDSWHFARKQRTWARGMGWRAVDRDEVLEAAGRVFS